MRCRRLREVRGEVLLCTGYRCNMADTFTPLHYSNLSRPLLGSRSLAEDDEDEEEEEQELSIIFKEISRDNYLDLQTIKEWEEVKNLLEENLISEKELEELWKETPKAPGSENR